MGDINDKSTFDSAAKWLEVVRSHTSLRLSTAIPASTIRPGIRSNCEQERRRNLEKREL